MPSSTRMDLKQSAAIGRPVDWPGASDRLFLLSAEFQAGRSVVPSAAQARHGREDTATLVAHSCCPEAHFDA